MSPRKTASKLFSSNPGVSTIGLDIGYGVTKVIGEGLPPILFPSVAGLSREVKFGADDLVKRYPGDQISDDEGDWFVGNLALSQLPPGETTKLRRRGADNDSVGNVFRLRMLKVALGKLFAGTRNGDAMHIRVATGLPVDHMRSASALKSALLGVHHIQTDTADFVANVVEVMVMPQPYGTLYANMLTPTGDVDVCHTANRTGVVDVGTYTVDIAVDDNGEYIDAESGSTEAGVSTAQDRIAAVLESAYNEKPNFRDVEQTLRTGCYSGYGKKVNFSNEVELALEPMRKATSSFLVERWGAASRLDIIYISGGGASFVETAVKSTFPQAVLVRDSQLANARGYLNYAAAVAKHGQ